MTEKKDVFYYAKLHGIPIYFQPEENEVVGRNLFCEFLLWLFIPFEPLFVSEEGFKFEIEHRTITREELRKKGVGRMTDLEKLRKRTRKNWKRETREKFWFLMDVAKRKLKMQQAIIV